MQKEQALAFALAAHERLGNDSPAGGISGYTLQDIVTMACRRKPYIFAINNNNNYVAADKHLMRYDVEENCWSVGRPVWECRSDAAMASVGEYAYLMGGGAMTGGLVDRYDPKTDSWEEMAGLPYPGACGAAATLGDHIYMSGGSDERCNVADTFVRYHPDCDKWITMSPVPIPVAQHTMSVVRDRLVVAGGFLFDISAMAKMWWYDPRAGSWSATKADMPGAPCNHAAAVVNDTLYIMGGTNLIIDGYIGGKYVCCYDAVADRWRSVSPMAYVRTSAKAVAIGEFIYLIGGNSHVTNETVARYDTAKDKWEVIGQPTKLSNCSIAMTLLYLN